MNQISLLIVDDDPHIAELVSDVAKEIGFYVGIATDKTITQVYQEIHPEVIVLDLLMPDKDGFETMQFLSEYCSNARVVILSGQEKSSREMAERLGKALKLTVVENIGKPFRIAELREKLQVIYNVITVEKNVKTPHAI